MTPSRTTSALRANSSRCTARSSRSWCSYNFDIAATAKGIAAPTGRIKALRIPLPSREDYYQQLAHFCRKYRAGWFGEGQGSILNRTHHGEILRVNGKPPPWTFQNPISETPVQDPFVTFDKESGYYYFLCTPAYGDQIEIRRGRVANKLVNTEAAGDRCIAASAQEEGRCPIVGNITTPELHKEPMANGTSTPTARWHNLSTGGNKALDAELGDRRHDDLMDGEHVAQERPRFTDMIEASEHLFVLQSKGDDPFGGFEFKGILDKTISALDPTIFTGHDGVLYMAYARQIAGTQIELRKMKDYLSFDPDVKPIPVVTANSTSDIFEAPAFIQKDGRTFLIYSCNGRWSNSGKMMIRESPVRCVRNSRGDAAAPGFLVQATASTAAPRARPARADPGGTRLFFSSLTARKSGAPQCNVPSNVHRRRHHYTSSVSTTRTTAPRSWAGQSPTAQPTTARGCEHLLHRADGESETPRQEEYGACLRLRGTGGGRIAVAGLRLLDPRPRDQWRVSHGGTEDTEEWQ